MEALIEFRLAATDEPIMLRVSQIQMLKPYSMAIRTCDGLVMDVTKEDWPAVEKAFRASCGCATTTAAEMREALRWPGNAL